MLFVQGAIAAIFRSAGKILSTVFGWATILLFGRVARSRQLYLSAINFGSVLWLVVLIGVAYPPFATWMLGFVTLPQWINDEWVRPGMIVATAIIPPALGAVSLLMIEPSKRPTTLGGRVAAIVRGYPHTLGFALALVMLTGFAPFMMLPTILRRWTTQHVAVIVESKDYLNIVAEVEKLLAETGFELKRHSASWMMRFPTKVLTVLAGGAVKNQVADQLAVLKGRSLEVTLHPSDLVISGKEHEVARARAVISERMAFSPAHFTSDKEANALEDRLAEIWSQIQTHGTANDLEARRQLAAVAHALERVDFPYEEWEVLFRQQLLVERRILQRVAHEQVISGTDAGEAKGPSRAVKVGLAILTRAVAIVAPMVANRIAAHLSEQAAEHPALHRDRKNRSAARARIAALSRVVEVTAPIAARRFAEHASRLDREYKDAA